MSIRVSLCILSLSDDLSQLSANCGESDASAKQAWRFLPITMQFLRLPEEDEARASSQGPSIERSKVLVLPTYRVIRGENTDNVPQLPEGPLDHFISSSS